MGLLNKLFGREPTPAEIVADGKRRSEEYAAKEKAFSADQIRRQQDPNYAALRLAEEGKERCVKELSLGVRSNIGGGGSLNDLTKKERKQIQQNIVVLDYRIAEMRNKGYHR